MYPIDDKDNALYLARFQCNKVSIFQTIENVKSLYNYCIKIESENKGTSSNTVSDSNVDYVPNPHTQENGTQDVTSVDNYYSCNSNVFHNCTGLQIGTCLQENLGSSFSILPTASQFKKTSSTVFAHSKHKKIVLELILQDNDDLCDLQYCLLLLHFLQDKKADYYLLISGKHGLKIYKRIYQTECTIPTKSVKLRSGFCYHRKRP